MLNKKGFVLIESIMLFEIVCLIILLLSLCIRTYFRLEQKSTYDEKQEERIKDVYE